MARPSSFREEFIEQAYKLALLGLTDEQLAGFFGVTFQTLNNWKKQHPLFFESIKNGRGPADADVVVSLNKRAKGFEHTVTDKKLDRKGNLVEVTTTIYYPPDPLCCFYWLNNRQRPLWKNYHKSDGGDKPDDGTLNELLDKLSESRGSAHGKSGGDKPGKPKPLKGGGS